MPENPIYLEVDSSITEQQLKLIKNESEELEKLFSKGAKDYPSQQVKPFPGLCVKSKDASGNKFFVNLCHCDRIPEPPDDFTILHPSEVLEQDLTEFRVPMSIGQVRPERDAKGEECKVCDVAINSFFFKRISNNIEWKNFVLTIIFEAIKEKYKIDFLDGDKIVLQNKKHIGTLQTHMIQDRDMAKKMGIQNPPKLGEGDKPKIETLSSVNFEARRPEYRLYRKKKTNSCLVGEFRFPEVISAKELKVDIGEDRIIVESEERNYLLDIFVPLSLRADTSTCIFDRATKILTVTIPLAGG